MSEIHLPFRFELDLPNKGLRSLLPLVKTLKVFFLDDLEIDPYKRFSYEFSSSYWYIKYMLTQYETVPIDEEKFIIFDTEEINVEWLTITDLMTFKIKCQDGDHWFLETSGKNEKLEILLKKGQIKKIACR